MTLLSVVVILVSTILTTLVNDYLPVGGEFNEDGFHQQQNLLSLQNIRNEKDGVDNAVWLQSGWKTYLIRSTDWALPVVSVLFRQVQIRLKFLLDKIQIETLFWRSIQRALPCCSSMHPNNLNRCYRSRRCVLMKYAPPKQALPNRQRALITLAQSH